MNAIRLSASNSYKNFICWVLFQWCKTIEKVKRDKI